MINPRPSTLASQIPPENLHLIQQPKPKTGMWISILAGLGIPLALFTVMGFVTRLMPHIEDTRPIETIPPWIIFPVIMVCVPVHEFLHLICHPRWGLSKYSIVLVWLRKFQFGVYYDGFMTRTRWLVMRLLPFIGLTILPALFLSTDWVYRIRFLWEVFITLTILVNSLGAGSDIVASVIVARQVPADGEVGIWNGRAYWRRAE